MSFDAFAPTIVEGTGYESRQSLNNGAISDVERTSHVIATVHKLLTMADVGDDLFLLGDDLEAILDLLDGDEALQEQFSSEVSAKYRNIHLYVVCFQKNVTKLHAIVRQQ